MADQLRILHVVAPAPVGGLERVVWALARGQREGGQDTRLLAVLDPGSPCHPFVESLREMRVPVSVAEIPARHYGLERAAVRDLCAQFRPHVVHTHGARVDVVDGGVPSALGVPVVTTVHGFTGGGLKNRLYEWLQVRAFRRYDAVVAVARSQVPRLKAGGVAADRLYCVPNAWSPEASPRSRQESRAVLGLTSEAVTIGWVGRLTRVKGCDVFIRALAHIADLEIEACVVGDGPERQAAEAQARKLAVADRVRWLGAVPAAGRLLAAFDVLVLSSRSEGTPIVLLEAAAAGTPVVATAVGGIPDVLRDGEAILVPPDDPRALARGIRASLEDPKAARGRSARARGRVTRDFAVPPWLAAYEAVYRTAIASRQGARR